MSFLFDDIDLSPLCRQPDQATAEARQEITVERFSDLVFETLRPHPDAFRAVNEALRRWYRDRGAPPERPAAGPVSKADPRPG